MLYNLILYLRLIIECLDKELSEGTKNEIYNKINIANRYCCFCVG